MFKKIKEFIRYRLDLPYDIEIGRFNAYAYKHGYMLFEVKDLTKIKDIDTMYSVCFSISAFKYTFVYRVRRKVEK